jgi:hypothetical protein
LVSDPGNKATVDEAGTEHGYLWLVQKTPRFRVRKCHIQARDLFSAGKGPALRWLALNETEKEQIKGMFL